MGFTRFVHDENNLVPPYAAMRSASAMTWRSATPLPSEVSM